MALVTLSLSLAGQASALDGHEQADMSATKAMAQSETEASTEAAAAAEAEVTTTMEAKVSDTKESKETEVTVETDAKASFEEKVEAYNKDKGEKDKVVCRREKRTGSHFSRRRCVTAAQAEREREDAQDALQRSSRGSNAGPIN